MTIFPQWEQFVALVRNIAGSAADTRSRYVFKRVDLTGGRGVLSDRAANQVTLEGGSVTLVLPETEPGIVHDLLVRATCTAETALSFGGGELEGDGEESLAAPAAGETAVYLLTETAPGTWLVSRKAVTRIGESEGG